MTVERDLQETAFDLKRKGRFQEAIDIYTGKYYEASKTGDKLLALICFEQMFDLLLLEEHRQSLQEEENPVAQRRHPRFRTKEDLLKKMEIELKEHIKRVSERVPENFPELMDRCKSKLNKFSVDIDWLTKKRAN